jgi:membrane-bound lytic murein transglycosylase MltF
MSERCFNRIVAALFVLLFWMMLASPVYGQIPAKSLQYRKFIHAEIGRVWGLQRPENIAAISAGTIHQESGWNPAAQSPYAKGLTQFTDGTWGDMTRLDPSISALGDVWSPYAAIRAMVVYHNNLWKQFKEEPTGNNNRWAFVLSSYNGGLGNVRKDQRLCKTKPTCDCALWFGHTELYSGRAAWAFKENRGYPRNIIKRWVPLFERY